MTSRIILGQVYPLPLAMLCSYRDSQQPSVREQSGVLQDMLACMICVGSLYSGLTFKLPSLDHHWCISPSSSFDSFCGNGLGGKQANLFMWELLVLLD